MRIAVSGSHGTGKSTLIAAFLTQSPSYLHEPEAFEVLADEISLLPSEGPDLDGLTALLDYTLTALANHPRGACVIFERSPVDYLAYAAATEALTDSERTDFLDTHVSAVRAAVRALDLIVLLPVSSQGPIGARPGEDESFRERVDEELRRALLDDEYDLFDADGGPVVVELSPSPEHQLAELLRRV